MSEEEYDSIVKPLEKIANVHSATPVVSEEEYDSIAKPLEKIANVRSAAPVHGLASPKVLYKNCAILKELAPTYPALGKASK